MGVTNACTFVFFLQCYLFLQLQTYLLTDVPTATPWFANDGCSVSVPRGCQRARMPCACPKYPHSPAAPVVTSGDCSETPHHRAACRLQRSARRAHAGTPATLSRSSVTLREHSIWRSR